MKDPLKPFHKLPSPLVMAGTCGSTVYLSIPCNKFTICTAKPLLSVSSSISISSRSKLTRRKNHLRIKILKTLTKPPPSLSLPFPLKANLQLRSYLRKSQVLPASRPRFYFRRNLALPPQPRTANLDSPGARTLPRCLILTLPNFLGEVLSGLALTCLLFLRFRQSVLCGF